MAKMYLDPRTFIFEGKAQIITKIIAHYETDTTSTATLTATVYDQDNNSTTIVNAAAMTAGTNVLVAEAEALVPAYLVEIEINNSEDLTDLYGIEAIVSHSIPVSATADATLTAS